MAVKWTLNDLAKMGRARVDDKKDLIIAITGARGDGKSTLGYKVAYKLKAKFNPNKDMLYSIKNVLDWYSKYKNKVLLFDEAIAVHNREFYQKVQIKLIKVLNMYRDSYNVLIVCVPNFSNLDTQLRQLIRLRIHIDSRGLGIVLMPKLGAFNKDIWETDYNSKIEQSFLARNKKINWRKLSTFVGFVYFGDLTARQREVYERIKDEKRNVIYEEDETDVGIMERFYKKFLEGEYNRQMFNALALTFGKRVNTLETWVRRKMKDDGVEGGLRVCLRKN